jgi:hypothetical protein
VTEGRCETCAHWGDEGERQGEVIPWLTRTCDRIHSGDGVHIYCDAGWEQGSNDHDLDTMPQFGCIFYEAAALRGES